MTTDDRDDRLDALADEAARKAMELAAEGELLTPVLLVEDDARQVHRYLLQGPSHPSEAMKVLLYTHRALRAAICFEGWGIEVAPPEGQAEAWKRQAMRGGGIPGLPRVSEHPDRYDQLVLIGQVEARPAGYAIYRSWRIEAGPPRTFTPLDQDGGMQAPSNFWPMFATPEVVRQLIRFDAALQALRDRARRPPGTGA